MKNNKIIIGILLLIVSGLGYILFVSNYELNESDRLNIASDHAGMSQDTDRHFIEQMIPHHEGAISMSKIAVNRSKRPEVISLANSIIESQSKEIDDMKRWYKSWFGSSVVFEEEMIHMGGMEGDVEILNSVSSNDFDREFVKQMIPHHEMAIMMVRMLSSSSERSEMIQLVKNINESQSREIELMRSWLESWVK